MHGPDQVHQLRTSSHVPLITGVLSVFPVKFALEQGSGRYSTPVLQQFVAKVISVESDTRWTSLVAEKVPNHEFRRPPSQCAQNRPPSTLSPEELAVISNYYASLDREFADLTPRLLFIDGYSCERTPAFNAIHTNYDMVVVHDTAPWSVSHHYEYGMMKTTYARYLYGVQSIGGMEIPETTLFTRIAMSDTQRAALGNAIDVAVAQYCAQNETHPTSYSYTLTQPIV